MRSVLLLFMSVITFSSCSTTTGSVASSSSPYTRASTYPGMYSTDQRKTVMIMPPINQTVNVEAKEYLYSSLAKPLCDKGYYVLSPFLALETLKDQSAYDAELYINGNLKKLNEAFGADLALFTIIHKWDKSVLTTSVTIEVEYLLKSTITGNELFHRLGTVVVDTQVKDENDDGGIARMLAYMAASAINTAMTKKMNAVRSCNGYVLEDLPCGVYSDQYNKDQNVSADGPDVTLSPDDSKVSISMHRE